MNEGSLTAGRYWFSLAILAAVAGLMSGAPVEFVRVERSVDVKIGGSLVTSYRHPTDHPKAFLYPLHTPAGVMLCRQFPFKKVPGESDDHPHHAGIFFAYDRVNGNNFWLNTAKSPWIEHLRFTEMKAGDDEGRLGTVSHWIGKDGTILLEEKRLMIFRGAGDHWSVDFDIALTAQKEKVTFGDTKEGLLGIRLADWMREPFEKKAGVIGISGTGNGKYLNSAGAEGESNVWGRRANWVALHASNDGKAVGVAIFDHPSSVNHPTYWHARGYGLFAANPLGQGVFEASRNPKSAKPLALTLQPDQSARFRYRVLIYDGTKSKQQIDVLYKSFAKE